MSGDGLFMPSGSGGLMRYNEEYRSKLSISPNGVALLIICVIVGMFILNWFLR